MLLRVLLVVAGLAVAAWAFAREDAVRSCDAAGQAAFRSTSEAGASAAATRSEAECRGGAALASGATVLAARGFLTPARRLAEASVRREPENSAGWVALGGVARAADDAAGLARAREELRGLDPKNRVLD